MSQLSAAVVVIAVAIATIGLGITADDAGADSEPKSRLFVVSSVLALMQNTVSKKTNSTYSFSQQGSMMPNQLLGLNVVSRYLGNSDVETNGSDGDRNHHDSS